MLKTPHFHNYHPGTIKDTTEKNFLRVQKVLNAIKLKVQLDLFNIEPKSALVFSISISEFQTESRKELKILDCLALSAREETHFCMNKPRQDAGLASPTEKHCSRKSLLNSINWF